MSTPRKNSEAVLSICECVRSQLGAPPASASLEENRQLHRAESLAGVELGGFHALRRKWATDRKGQPLVDVANAGDWHPATLLSHYQKADPATTLRVVLGGAKAG